MKLKKWRLDMVI